MKRSATKDGCTNRGVAYDRLESDQLANYSEMIVWHGRQLFSQRKVTVKQTKDVRYNTKPNVLVTSKRKVDKVPESF